MNREETLKLFINKLKKRKNFFFFKVGDDCVYCMQFETGSNSDGHFYSSDYAERMKEAYIYMAQQPEVYFAEWEDSFPGILHDTVICRQLRKDNDLNPQYVFFDALLSHEDQYLTSDLKEFYRVLKNDSRPKYYFARERMREVARVFNMTFVPVPHPNSYLYFEKVKQQVKKILKPNIIILFSCGMLAKIMLYECHKMSKEITVLDMGSAFDPLFVGDTRSNIEGQHLRVKEFFKDLL